MDTGQLVQGAAADTHTQSSAGKDSTQKSSSTQLPNKDVSNSQNQAQKQDANIPQTTESKSVPGASANPPQKAVNSDTSPKATGQNGQTEVTQQAPQQQAQASTKASSNSNKDAPAPAPAASPPSTTASVLGKLFQMTNSNNNNNNNNNDSAKPADKLQQSAPKNAPVESPGEKTQTQTCIML